MGGWVGGDLLGVTLMGPSADKKRVGRWVGGWVGGRGGWVGGWVQVVGGRGGWKRWVGGRRLTWSDFDGSFSREKAGTVHGVKDLGEGGWVGGWVDLRKRREKRVGGWVGGWVGTSKERRRPSFQSASLQSFFSTRHFPYSSMTVRWGALLPPPPPPPPPPPSPVE